MAGFDIFSHDNYEEIQVTGDLTVAMVREVVGELVKSPDFLTRHVVWVFGGDVRPPAFHEFNDLVALLEKVYARGRADGKKVALVTQGSFVRSVAEMFLGQARGLPVALRVFDSVDDARDWIRG